MYLLKAPNKWLEQELYFVHNVLMQSHPEGVSIREFVEKWENEGMRRQDVAFSLFQLMLPREAKEDFVYFSASLSCGREVKKENAMEVYKDLRKGLAYNSPPRVRHAYNAVREASRLASGKDWSFFWAYSWSTMKESEKNSYLLKVLEKTGITHIKPQ